MFFLIAVLLVGGIALYLGDFWNRARSYTITAYFENVQGLPEGSEVRFAGVKIGRVVDVLLETHRDYPKKPAAVRMAIMRDVALYDTDGFVIQQGALLGDKFVDVQRLNDVPRLRLKNGAAVSGGGASGLEELTTEARKLVQEARSALKSITGVVATDFNAQAFKQILINVMSATHKADTVASQAIRLANILTQSAAKTGPDVAAMARNLKNASASVQSTAQLVRHVLATSPVPRDLAVASGNVRDASQDLVAMSDNIGKVLADPATREKIQGALDNLQKSTESLASMTCQAEKILGDGTVGADIREAVTRLKEAAASVAKITATYEDVLTDPKFTGDVTATVAATRQAAETGAKAIARAEKSLERVDETMERVTKVTRIIRPEEVWPRASLEGAQHGGLRGDVDVDLQYGTNRNDFWRVGIRDVGDAERLNLQKSFPTGNGRARAGIFGNKLGVGYDLHPDSRLGWEAELRDPNDLTGTLRGIYRVGPQSDLLFGLDGIGEGGDPFLGYRYRMKP
ncbi:MAG: MlaD family protein [Armatimonadia bacterium]